MRKITEKWLEYARADLEGAEVLVKAGKSSYSYQLAVLHCHQAIEKILKTIIVDREEVPKRTHNLIFLLGQANLEISHRFRDYVERLNPHYQPSRYPDFSFKGVIAKYTRKVTKYHLEKTKELFLWLEKKLISEK